MSRRPVETVAVAMRVQVGEPNVAFVDVDLGGHVASLSKENAHKLRASLLVVLDVVERFEAQERARDGD